jgi:prepilin-type N-terminal cleavage/methylation domain-containing protein
MHPFRKIGRAFTLIELLIVVAIIAILAAIAVPNFLEAQTRAKVSRFMADLRSCATALEAYFVDHNAYPAPDSVPAVGEASGCPSSWFAPPDGVAEGFMSRRLTTPVAYITTLPTDIFTHNREPEPCHPRLHPPHFVNDRFSQRTFTDPEDQSHVARTFASLRLGGVARASAWDRSVIWLAHSHGPDLDHDDFESDQGFPTQYDPTNGTISDGDIFYFGPSRGFTGR